MGAKCCSSLAEGGAAAPPGDALADGQWKPSTPWEQEETTVFQPTARASAEAVLASSAGGASASNARVSTSNALELPRGSLFWTEGEGNSRTPSKKSTPMNNVSKQRRMSGTSSLGNIGSEKTTSVDEETFDLLIDEFHRTRSDGYVHKDPSRRTSTSSGRKPGVGCIGRRDLPAEICCLAWTLGVEDGAYVQDDDLMSLHEHIATCVDLFGAEVLLEQPTFGLLRGIPRPDNRLNAEDTALRMGQLICRYAASSNVGLGVGVHTGSVRQIKMPGSDKEAYFGEACQGATQLAESSFNWTVHISGQAKAKLSAFRQAQMTISPDRSSYHLSPSTVVGNYFGGNTPKKPLNTQLTKQSIHDATLSTGLAPLWSRSGSKDEPGSRAANSVVTSQCTFPEFETLLTSHNVDIASFGKGSASSLHELYKAVVVDRKNDLILTEMGTLERIVNLVRISLRIRDNENKLRELRLVSDTLGDSSRGSRNMPLAITLHLPETSRWREALEKCFEQKLCLSSKVQRSCFNLNMEAYKYMEECAKSERFPGLMTTYKSHNVVINVKDKQAEALKNIGLPHGECFTCTSSCGELKTWTWALVGNTREDELMNLLQSYGIDASELDPHAFAELHDEVHTRFLSVLDVQHGELVRTVRVVKVWLHAEILNVDHVLTVKAKFRRGHSSNEQDRAIAMRMRVDQDWEEAVYEVLSTRLGLSESWQARNLNIERSTHRVSEEIGYSKSYPGLKTCYLINEVNVHVVDTRAVSGLIGLPGGTDFSFARKETLQDPEAGELVVTHFHWLVKDDIEQQRSILLVKQATVADIADEPEPVNILRSTTWHSEAGLCSRNRVPAPIPLEVFQGSDSVSMQFAKGSNVDVATLATLMRNKQTDWTRARTAAKRIRDPKYTCREFHDDVVAAFPELRLYCVSDPGGDSAHLGSGRTADDEYQRTIGALFAVFWLMRMDIGGKDGFCLGVESEDWRPRESDYEPSDEVEKEQLSRRLSFREAMDWGGIWRLLKDAGLVSSKSSYEMFHDEERTLAMLVLMAIHDIMKVSSLLPIVDKKVKQFCGYKSGELISDHDVALGYVLTHHADLLPSFSGLPKAQQETVKFTHCKLDYNMGWLVQAEAPPGALFKTFRKVVMAGKAAPRDIAFYFVHWFVDLAGAEPSPLNGCEKFVLRFPQHVLARFMESFSFVQALSTNHTETVVMEEYLAGCWERMRPSLGAAPEGEGAIARMRLVLMAQGDSFELMRCYDALAPEDRAVLSEELAFTGCKDQSFSRDLVVPGRGPAILLYYAPALLQKMAGKESQALHILAEVWRQARELWPLSKKEADNTVTVRIDALKELEPQKVLNPDTGHIWVISKTSHKDAVVKLLPASDLKSLNWQGHQVISFARTTRRKKSRGRIDLLLTDVFKSGGSRSSSASGGSSEVRYHHAGGWAAWAKRPFRR